MRKKILTVLVCILVTFSLTGCMTLFEPSQSYYGETDIVGDLGFKFPSESKVIIFANTNERSTALAIERGFVEECGSNGLEVGSLHAALLSRLYNEDIYYADESRALGYDYLVEVRIDDIYTYTHGGGVSSLCTSAIVYDLSELISKEVLMMFSNVYAYENEYEGYPETAKKAGVRIGEEYANAILQLF